MTRLTLSRLGHTWLIDVDGTIMSHNRHLTGQDMLLPSVADFWRTIPEQDHIVLLSARPEPLRQATLEAISAAGLRYDQAIFGLPAGERVLINDSKPSGLVTALAIPVDRDAGLGGIEVTIDPDL